MTEPAARPAAKPPARVADMLLSLAVIMIPLLVIVVMFTRNLPDAPVKPVEVTPVLQRARNEAGYQVLAPSQLPADWTPTRVAWHNDATGGDWQVGYLGPDRIYYEVRQSSADAASFIAQQTRDATPVGPVVIPGSKLGGGWQHYVSADGRTVSLVRSTAERGRNVTTVISADSSLDAVLSFAATLTP